MELIEGKGGFRFRGRGISSKNNNIILLIIMIILILKILHK